MRRSTRYLIGFVAVLGFNCDPPKQIEQETKTIANDNDFFGSGLMEGTTELGDDYSTVPCPGVDAPIEDDLRVIRGRVFAPNGQLASGYGLPFVRTALAVTLPNDGAVADAEIAIYNVKDSPIAVTTTDALGRWCLDIRTVQFSAKTRISASKNGTILRRVTPFAEPAVISPVTEAFVRIVESKNLNRDGLVNAKMISETTIQLLTDDLPEGESVEDAIEKTTSVLLADPRLKNVLR